MADFEDDLTVKRTQLLDRGDRSFTVKGQAGFFSVALKLHVPVLSQQNSIKVDANPVLAGEGASFSVARSLEHFEPDPVQDLVNDTAKTVEWYQSSQVKHGFRRFVTKQLVAIRNTTTQADRTDSPRDAEQIVALINEVRILSTESMRECPFIVNLLCVSWHENPTDDDRFWPQLILEAADRGTLRDYLESEKPDLSTRLYLAMTIERGLAFIHGHGVVHGDLKPENILVFSEGISPERQALAQQHGQTLVETKISDFGFAVIMDDYPENSMFNGLLGTKPWIAPELDLGHPIPVNELYKADVYSFGLVAGSVLMGSPRPFDGLLDNEIAAAKENEPYDAESAVAIIMKSIKRGLALTEEQEDYIEALLAGACDPSPRFRVCLPAINNFLLVGITQEMGKESLAVPLDAFPLFSQAQPGYYNALRILDKKYKKPTETETQFHGFPEERKKSHIQIMSEVQRLIASVRARRLIGPKNEEMLASILADHTPPSSKITRFARARNNFHNFEDEEFDIHILDEISGRVVPLVPDLAYERGYSISLMQRVAMDEIMRDLQMQASSDNFDDAEVAFQLAGACFNGQIIEVNPELGFHFLNKAVEMDSFEAIAVATNIYDSYGLTMPERIRNIIQDGMKSYATLALAKTIPVLFTIANPLDIDFNLVFIRSWLKLHGDEYFSFIKSDMRRVSNSATSALNSSLILRAKVPLRKPIFDFDQLGYGNTNPDRFNMCHKANFVKNVAKLGCLEMPDYEGFTLLQAAVVRDDLEMMKVLVKELGANLNEYGNTLGWTPLLLACHCGHFSIAEWLVKNGANVKCRDSNGASILHSIHHFSLREQCNAVVEWALKAGLNINCSLREGMSPLHATFVGWDYSLGGAAEVLLEHGADPTTLAKGNGGHFNRISPIGLCAERLDENLLFRMLWAASLIPEAQERLAFCKAEAFFSMAQKTRFHYMSIGGDGYEARLVSVLEFLVDDKMKRYLEQVFGSTNIGPWNILLHFATHFNRNCFVEALLTARPEIDVNAVAKETIHQTPGRPFIHLAIQRCGSEVTRNFIKRGANLLTKGHVASNAFHTAAHYFPRILLELIDVLEKMPMERRGHKTVKQILEEPNSNGQRVFGLLLQEGYSSERSIAAELQLKYGLAYDYKISMSEDGDWTTLCGSLISIAVHNAIIPVDQIYYLLDLKPPPQFVCGSDGSTLLTRAITGLMSYQDSNDLPGHQILAKVLEKYGSYENILLGPNNTTAFHQAAFWANRKAIEMMTNFITTKYPDKEIPWNLTASKNGTALDFAAHEVGKTKLMGNTELAFDQLALRTKRSAAIECYKFLRSKRALHTWELKGNCYAARPILSTEILKGIGQFMMITSVHLRLGQPDADYDEIVEVATSSPSGSNLITVPMVELAWRLDNFYLRFYRARFSSAAHELAKQFHDYVVERRRGEDFRHYEWMNLEPGIYPFMRMEYEYQIDGDGTSAKWSRGGRIWTFDEVRALGHRFSEMWTDHFGEAEARLGFPQMEGMDMRDE